MVWKLWLFSFYSSVYLWASVGVRNIEIWLLRLFAHQVFVIEPHRGLFDIIEFNFPYCHGLSASKKRHLSIGLATIFLFGLEKKLLGDVHCVDIIEFKFLYVDGLLVSKKRHLWIGLAIYFLFGLGKKLLADVHCYFII